MIRLEDPDSEETKEFVEKQVNLTDLVLKTCETREKLREKITKLYDFPKYEVPFRAGDKYFYFHNSGLQPQKVLYVQVCKDSIFSGNNIDDSFGQPQLVRIEALVD